VDANNVKSTQPLQIEFLRSNRLLQTAIHAPSTKSTIVVPQFKHRIALVESWQVKPGSSVLDIGCGQGESSLVLALAVGPKGHITGIDTAPPDYGGPYTVGEAQDYISRSTLGPRITFKRTNTARLLRDSREQQRPIFDCAVFRHSLCYFPSLADVSSVFRSLSSAGISRLCLADYAFTTSLPEQVPHI
jgi:SAM-dependent methyltransferase